MGNKKMIYEKQYKLESTKKEYAPLLSLWSFAIIIKRYNTKLGPFTEVRTCKNSVCESFKTLKRYTKMFYDLKEK